ncbi:MAG: hypothetical protein FD146_2254 [Anaerolineaceae bacterium]|nr:MAG: hypothetical protein FD146_2254 [Anaerolineaceae bacterium]
MTTQTFRDIEQLSAHLDGQLRQAERARLESRIETDRELAAALLNLRLARAVLRRTPQRRAPRNFTLTPKMAGIRPPVPRLVPAFSWASAAAMLFFVCTLGTNLLGQFSFGAAAPMAAAPGGMGGGGGYGGGPAEDATAAPLAVENASFATPTPESQTLMAPESTAAPALSTVEGPGARAVQPPEDTAKRAEPVNSWPYIWLGLAAALIASALLIRWGNMRAFRRKAAQKQE